MSDFICGTCLQALAWCYSFFFAQVAPTYHLSYNPGSNVLNAETVMHLLQLLQVATDLYPNGALPCVRADKHITTWTPAGSFTQCRTQKLFWQD